MLPLLEHLDHQLFFWLNHGLSTPLLDTWMWWISFVGDGLPLTVTVGILLWCLDRPVYKRHYLWLVAGVIIGSLVVQALKHGLGRPRPLKEFAMLIQAGTVHVNVIGDALRYRSFPSGHTQAAASVFVYLMCLYPRYWYGWGVGIVLVGLSRVYLGVHFPLDVMVGALLGTMTALGAWRCQDYGKERAWRESLLRLARRG